RYSSARGAHLLVNPSDADEVARLLGIGHPGRTSKQLAIFAGTPAGDGAGDHANLGGGQVSTLGHAGAQRPGGLPAGEISGFPRFDELESEGRRQPGLARLVDPASQEGTAPFAD